MDLTREEAIKLHRQMWTDMQKELGNRPTHHKRFLYKEKWVSEAFPDERIMFDCFLCEYAKVDIYGNCDKCPIDWGKDRFRKNTCQKIRSTGTDWRYSPISEILALPEREDV